MKYFLLIISFFLLSCGNKKVLQLPEISTSEITEINDVSHAYLFYDETKKDSLELNRKNLISTTNWLINVDKRLTLKQAIPHIKFLQDKKDNSSHKNKNAKNYFTCNDSSRKDLGFIEFTDIIYEFDTKNETFTSLNSKQELAFAKFYSLNKIETSIIFHEHGEVINFSFLDFLKYIDKSKNLSLKLSFNSRIPFQDYITVKSMILARVSNNLHLFNHELIFN